MSAAANKSRMTRRWQVRAALAGACLGLLTAAGCSWFAGYRAWVAAEEAFAGGAKAAERNDLGGAERDFARALRLAPDSASLRARIGMAYMTMRPPRRAAALPHLRRALDLDPDQPLVVYQDAALAAALTGDEPWARELVAEVARRFRHHALALNNTGYLLVDAGVLVEESLPLLHRAVQLQPRSGIILDSLGWAYYRRGDLERAAELLAQASRLTPDHAEIEYHLGAAYAALGRSDDARRQFRRALRLDPAFEPARQALEELEAP